VEIVPIFLVGPWQTWIRQEHPLLRDNPRHYGPMQGRIRILGLFLL